LDGRRPLWPSLVEGLEVELKVYAREYEKVGNGSTSSMMKDGYRFRFRRNVTEMSSEIRETR